MLRALDRDTLRRIAGLFPYLAWSCRSDGYCDFISDSWSQYTGQTAEEATGWGWRSAIHKGDSDRCAAELLANLQLEANFSLELRVFHKSSGEYRWNKLDLVQIASGAKTRQWLASMIDIHQIKEAELEIRETRERLKLIVHDFPAAVFTCEPDGMLAFLSDYLVNFTGSSKQDLTTNWRNYIHPQDIEATQSQFHRCIDQKLSCQAEFRIKSADERYRWHLATIKPIVNSAGEVRRWTGIIVDIHEKMEQEVVLQRVMDSIPGAVWWKDLESRFLGCNKTNALRAGYDTPAELIGKTDFDCAWREQAEGLIESDKQVVRSNQALYHVIEPRRFDDGKMGWTDTSKVPLHDADGNIVGTVGNYIDITKVIKLMQQREDFMASLAHDLKVPIIGAIRLLEAFLMEGLGTLNDTQREFLQKLHHSHLGLLNIIQNLLQVLRYEASPEELQITDCDLAAVARACLDDVQSIAQAKQIQLKSAFSDEIPLRADATALKRLMLNLLGNALKFTPSGGSVELVILDWQADSVTIVITDTGPGIAKEDQKSLFERFWQGGGEKRYAAEIGLGLYLCRVIAEGHGGEIHVLSELGEGSSFVVSLPKPQAKPQD